MYGFKNVSEKYICFVSTTYYNLLTEKMYKKILSTHFFEDVPLLSISKNSLETPS